MKMLRTRKNVRLRGYNYSNAGVYFVTICIKDGHEMLGDVVVGDAPLRVPHVQFSEYGIFVDAQVQKINDIYPHVFLDNYTIMPNHVHLLMSIQDGMRGGASPTKALIPQVVQSLKSMTTKQFGFSMWQRSYHDHIIRTKEEYQRIWKYIDKNPARWTEDCYYNPITKG